MKRFLFFITVLSACFSSCEDPGKSEPVQLPDAAYFPLSTKTYRVYDVQEVRYTLSVPETLAYELKLVVADSFINAAGTPIWVISRARRIKGASAWEELPLWSARVDGSRAVITEGTISYVVLEFPLSKDKQWNGNALNDVINPFTGLNSDTYVVSQVREKLTLGTQEWSDCVFVTQEDEEDDILFVDRRSEVYARNVGLVMKETTQLRYCADTNIGCVGLKQIDEGVIYKQELTEHGKM